MAIHNAVGANRPKPRQPTLQTTRLPAPTRGIDARASAAEMAAENSIYSYNMVPAEYGLLLRKGFREWANGVKTDVDPSSVNTLMVYDGIIAGAVDDKLFAVTKEGIWAVTYYDTPPVLEAAFTIQDEGAGYGVHTHYIDQSGESFLLYADELNGLWFYTSTTGAWARPTGITGPDIEHVAFVVVHKQRLWLIEENQAKAWYLPIASKTGQAEEFFFGSKFPHGGRLRGLYNWSVDGGDGVDDYLVAVSSAGDITPYQGADPSSADSWSVVGTYYVGRVPRGRNFAGEYAGDLYILCSFGVIAMSDLLRGVQVMSDASNRDSLSYKIARPIREDMQNTREEYGWEPIFMPAQGMLLITTPQSLNTPTEQWTLNLATNGWGKWRGVPMSSAAEWKGLVYFGDANSAVHVMDVDRDGIPLAPAPAGVSYNGQPIEFSLMTSYQDYGAPTQFKIPQYIRPDFFSSAFPAYKVKAVYDYNIVEPLVMLAAPPDRPLEARWDFAYWDEAVWGGSELGIGQSKITGSAGMGRTIAIAIRGEAIASTRLLSIDVMWQNGGPV